MSRLQPTLTETIARLASIEATLAAAVWTMKVEGGWRVRLKRHRFDWFLESPVSNIEKRCDDCGCILRATRDCGGQGFYYDARWLRGNPAERDPRLHHDWESRYACLSCFNRVRARIRNSEQINDNRLLIGRIKRELKHAA